LNFGVIAIVIALAFSGKIYALPSGFTQVAASDWEAELRPSLLPKDVAVMSATKNHNVVLPGCEPFTLVGSGGAWNQILIHFLHVGVTNIPAREEHASLFSVMSARVATAHPFDMGGLSPVQYFHTSINVDGFGGSLADVGDGDMGTQRLAWVNNDRRVCFFRLINEIYSEPSPLVRLCSFKLLLINKQSQGSNYEHKNIREKLQPFSSLKVIRRVIGLLFLAVGATLFLYAQIIPLYHFDRKPIAAIVVAIALLVLGFLCTAQFYDLVWK
jgi:hypothetical protein